MKLNFYSQYRKSWRQEYKCCDGYWRSFDLCKPICRPDCGNGRCVQPNICNCDAGYRADETYSLNIGCVPVCSHTCVYGKCTEPEVCLCNYGYQLTDDHYICEPICNVPCATGSYCYKPDQCLCLDGYKMINSDDKLTNVSKRNVSK